MLTTTDFHVAFFVLLGAATIASRITVTLWHGSENQPSAWIVFRMRHRRESTYPPAPIVVFMETGNIRWQLFVAAFALLSSLKTFGQFPLLYAAVRATLLPDASKHRTAAVNDRHGTECKLHNGTGH